jgi:hypothetical protein
MVAVGLRHPIRGRAPKVSSASKLVRQRRMLTCETGGSISADSCGKAGGMGSVVCLVVGSSLMRNHREDRFRIVS